MKLTSKDLRRIIKEELQNVLAEQDSDREEFFKKRQKLLLQKQMKNDDNLRQAFVAAAKPWEKMFYSDARNTLEGVAAQVSEFVRDYIDSRQHDRLLGDLEQAVNNDSRKDLEDAVFAVVVEKFPQGVPAHISTLYTNYAMRKIPGQSSTNTKRSTDQGSTKSNSITEKEMRSIANKFLEEWSAPSGSGPSHPADLLKDRYNVDPKKAEKAAPNVLLLAAGINPEGDFSYQDVETALKKFILQILDNPGTEKVSWKRGSKRSVENAFLDAIEKFKSKADGEEYYSRGVPQKIKSFFTGRGFRE